MSSRRKLALALIALPFLLLLAAGGGLFAALYSDFGRELLREQIETAASEENGLRVKLGPIDGDLLSDFRIDGFVLADPAGDWLIAEQLSVSWSPLDLLDKRLSVTSLQLASLEILREPSLPPGEEEQSQDLTLPSLPFDLSIEQLRIDRIRIAEALAGQEAVFDFALRLNAPSGDALRSEIQLAQLEGGDAALSGAIAFDPKRETLGIDLTFAEPQGGVLASLAGLPGAPAVELSLLGDGPLSAWQGQLLAEAGDLFEADLLLVTESHGALKDLGSGKEEIRLSLQGSTKFGDLLPPDLATLVTPRLDLETLLLWSGESQSLVMESGRFESDVLRLTLNGRFQIPDQALSANLSLQTLDSAAIAPLIAPASFENAAIDLTVTGNLSALDANAKVSVDGLTPVPDLTLERVVGSYRSTVALQNLDLLPLEGTTLIEGFSGLPPEAARLIGPQLTLDFNLDFDLPENSLTLSALDAKGAGIALSGSAFTALESRKANADMALTLPDLSLVAPVSGALRSDVALSTADFEQGADVKVDAILQDLDPGDPKLKELIGERIELQLAAKATPDLLTLTSVNASSAIASIIGTGELPTSFERLSANFEIELPDMSPLSEIAGTDIGGSTRISGQLEGPLADPALKGEASLLALSIDGQTLGQLDNSFDLAQLASGPRGRIAARLLHPDVTLDLETDLAVIEFERLDLENLSLQTPGAEVAGALSLPFDGSPITGQLQGAVSRINTVARLADQNLDGKLDFSARLEEKEEGQAATLDLQATTLTLDRDDTAAPKIAELNAEIAGRDLLRSPGFTFTAKAKDLQAGGTQLDSFAIDAEGAPDRADFTFSLANREAPAIGFDGRGRVTLSGEVTRLEMSALDGAFEGRKIALLNDFTLTQSGDETVLDKLKLDLAGGEVTAMAELSPSLAKAEIGLSALPLELLTLVDPNLKTAGTLGGQADLQITENEALGTFELALDALKPEGEDFKNLPPLNGRMSGSLSQGQLSFTGQVSGLEGTEIVSNGNVPVEVTLAPFAAAVAENKPLDAALKLRGDLAGIWPLLALDEHLLAGRLAADLTIAGTLETPQVKGSATLSEGRYENLEAGTLLTDLSFEATLPDAQSVDIRLDTKDGDDGRISADGRVDLSDGTDPEISLTTNLKSARLLRRDDIFAQASGTIAVAGRVSDLEVTGDVASDLVEINVGGALPPSIVDLPVEERNRPGEEEAAAAEQEARQDAAPSTIDLDLGLTLPRRVFIRGRGLDSEWAGQFKVTGTAAAPVIEGDLSPVRGDFSFAGKSFKLQKGKVSLAGGKDIDPDLDLSAVYELDDFKAVVAITGTASSPEIGFSSEPELPQDEILARILFGKSTGQLSPVEALQLAEAVASLSGKLGSGEGVLGLVRKTLGVDVLSAGTNEQSGEVEVRAGKYVADDVFVGVTQGADPTSTKVTVEVEVTPNISVESDVGQDASGRVGVFWKWDY